MLKVSITKELNQFQLNSNFEVNHGITGIIGPSGCGKSVTLQCIAGLVIPDSGEIIVNENHFFHADKRINIKTKNRNIGYVFQHYALFPHLTVGQNIAYGLKDFSKHEKNDKVAAMLEKVQLAGYEKHYPNQLSGGQQQRVALARTLVTEPNILLLDEPFSALDHHVKHLLEEELLQIIRWHFTGVVLLVTHNMEEAYRLCDQLLLYNNGSIVQAGTKDEVFKHPKNISAATIIGCKNILPFDSLSRINDRFSCTIAGTELQVKEQQVSNDAKAIGIHAENIHFVDKDTQLENTFPYQIKEVISGIHHSNVTVQAGPLFLRAIIPNKQQSSVLSENMHVRVPAEDLFVLDK